MKQSKRFLSVLLAMLMILSTFTIAAGAYKTSYDEPQGYDSVLTPYFSNDQAASALLDFLDDNVFASMDVHTSVVGIDIDIYSFDSLCDSIDNIFGSTVYKLGNFFLSLGDIEKLNVGLLRNSSNRRRSSTVSDFQLFIVLCQFCRQNYNILYKIADNTLDLGFIGNFWDMREEIPMLNNLHGYINDIVYKLLINGGQDTGYVAGEADNYNLDNILQDFLNNRVLTFVLNFLDEATIDTVVNFLGISVTLDAEGKVTNQMGLLDLLPSLKASDISITTTSTYDMVINIFNALIDDVVVKFGGTLILDLLKIKPDDPDEDTSYIDIAIGLFVDYQTLVDAGVVSSETSADDVNVTEEFLRWQGVENPDKPKPIDKVNVTLKYILKVGLKKFIHFVGTPGVDSHLQLTEYFSGMFSDLIRMVIPMLPTLAPQFTPLTSEQEAAVETMGDEELFAFLARMVLEAFVDGVYFPDDCKTIKALATYTLVNVAEEIIHDPNVDFQAEIDAGRLDPDSLDCLDIAAAVINYYLVGETTFESTNLKPTFEQLANDAFETFLGKYVSLFSMYPNSGDQATYGSNPWYKLYMSINQWIPLTNIIYGVEDSWYGMKNLVLDSIIGNILNFDINGLLGIIGRRRDSDLNKPFSQLVANLLARILNGVFKLPIEGANQSTNSYQLNNLIIPYDYTRLDQILTNVISSSTPGYSDTINGCGLKNTLKMLFYYIENATQSGAVMAESLDVIVELIGVIKLKDHDYMTKRYTNEVPLGTSFSINQLKELYENCKVPDNEGLKYYDDDYVYFHMVDFTPWNYRDFKKALTSARNIIEDYDNNLNPARSEITYAYWLLSTLHDEYLLANQPSAEIYYLQKYMNEYPRITSNESDGEQLYTNRSWDAYVKAYNFAQKVTTEYNEYAANMTLGDYPQSKVNEARAQLREAIHGLKLNAGLGDADYSELLTAISNLRYLDSPSKFTSKSVEDVVEAYNKALEFVREVWYDADSQIIVDGYTERLTKAYDLLVNIPLLQFYDDSMGIATDEARSYIYGLPTDFFNEEEQVDCDNSFTLYLDWYLFGSPTENCTEAELIPTSGGNGTGARIKLLSDDDGDGVMKTEREYTVVFFGDVNGDTYANGMDAVILRAYAARMLYVNNKTSYISIAGDADNDSLLSTDDAKLLEKCGVMKGSVDQNVSARMGDILAFTDIVKQ